MDLLVGNVKCLENLINFNFMIIAKLHRSVRIILAAASIEKGTKTKEKMLLILFQSALETN